MNAIYPLIIFYVDDQARASEFYRRVLDREPVLDVPGMTEFALCGGATLGLMPLAGIARLVGDDLIRSDLTGRLPPRAELYLTVDDPDTWHARAIAAGAIEILPIEMRDWGDIAGYVLDTDGHVLAFAKRAVSGE